MYYKDKRDIIDRSMDVDLTEKADICRIIEGIGKVSLDIKIFC